MTGTRTEFIGHNNRISVIELKNHYTTIIKPKITQSNLSKSDIKTILRSIPYFFLERLFLNDQLRIAYNLVENENKLEFIDKLIMWIQEGFRITEINSLIILNEF